MSHKILIVDDNRGCCDLYKMRFEYDKWNVIVAYTAEKALELLKRGYHPDAILLDIMLPKMQGDELLEILKSNPETKDIKVVIISAINFFKEKNEILFAQADDCIMKIDIMPNELVARVTKLVEGNSVQSQ